MAEQQGPVDLRMVLEFEVPRLLSEVDPQYEERGCFCSSCGRGSAILPRDRLMAVKHRHGSQPRGHVRFYCMEHFARTDEWGSSGSAGQRFDGPVCPRCFVAVPAGTRTCDDCGQVVP